MTDPKPRRMPFSAAEVHRALPVLAALLFLLGAWLAWSGWQQKQGTDGGAALQQARDATAQQTGAALAQARERFRTQLATPARELSYWLALRHTRTKVSWTASSASSWLPRMRRPKAKDWRW